MLFTKPSYSLPWKRIFLGDRKNRPLVLVLSSVKNVFWDGFHPAVEEVIVLLFTKPLNNFPGLKCEKAGERA
jgi:hypothetical protein